MKNIILLIAGDPNSINSELVFKSWRRLKQRTRKNIILIGSYNLIQKQKKNLNLI